MLASRPDNRILSALLLPLLVLGMLSPAPAAAAGDDPSGQGAGIFDSVRDGELTCDELDPAEFEAVGEFVMGRMLGSAEIHEQMDRRMASMMGEPGSDRMHEVMGVRFAGCGNPRLPGNFGGMMGMMGGGFGSGQRSVPGSMMDLDREGGGGVDWDGHMDLDGGWWMVMGIGMIVFWALVILGVVWLVRELARSRQERPDSDAVAILDRRLAAGEISPEEYRERRAILRGEPASASDEQV